MTHRIIRSAAFCLGLACFAGAASAEGVAGSWKFRTDALPSNGCFISGDIAFTKTAKADEFACVFVSQEDCLNADGVKTFQKVRQSCSAHVAGRQVVITSKVERMLDAGPASLRERLMRFSSYAPDNFAVELNNKGELTGQFQSLQKSGVRFWRDVDLVS
ncbi:MAG: hypothetical protein ABI740_10260 [Alphaproteobacteria bacterium]